MYAKKAGYGLNAQNLCAEGNIRCHRKIVRLLRDMGFLDRGRPKKGNTMLPLSDLGISLTESSRWQQQEGTVARGVIDQCQERADGCLTIQSRMFVFVTIPTIAPASERTGRQEQRFSSIIVAAAATVSWARTVTTSLVMI